MTTRKHPAAPAPDKEPEAAELTPAPEGDVAAAEAANAEVQAKADEATAKGYYGAVPDENPNDAYSILTGPDSPPLAPDDRTRFAQPSAPSTKETPA